MFWVQEVGDDLTFKRMINFMQVVYLEKWKER